MIKTRCQYQVQTSWSKGKQGWIKPVKRNCLRNATMTVGGHWYCRQHGKMKEKKTIKL